MLTLDSMAETNSEKETFAKLPTEDEVQIHLWQKALFLDSGKGGQDTADSLRLRMAQLDYHTLTERLSGHDTSHLHILMRDYLHQYSRVVDERDESRGMNNFTSPALTLAAGNTNDCKNWKSELTFEKVMEMPELKALLTKDKGPSPSSRHNISGCTSTLLSERRHSQQKRPLSSAAIDSSQKPTTSPTSAVQCQDVSRVQVQALPGSSKDFTRNQPHLYSGPSTSNPSRRYETENISEQRQRPLRSSSGQLANADDEGVPRSKRARMVTGGTFEGNKERDGNENGDRKNQAFITARDQYQINQQKKFGGGGGRPVNTNSYGMSKRSLGTRRTTGSKFVPPVKQDNEGSNDSHSKFEESVRSRVMAHGGGSSCSGSGGSNLPPELEGNERLKNIEPRMVELIINEIMDSGAPVQWDDIAGLNYAKESIKEIVVWPMMRPDLFTGLRGPPKGILLFGPPGTGKTLIGKCIASQVEATFFSISASSLTSKWIGEGEKMVRALFAVARCYQPAVIFIDEIDSLLSQRSDTEHESSRRIKTEFLIQLDGATTSADDRLLVIGATNRPQEIDEAARRRLVKRLYIPLPDGQARRQLVDNLMRQQPFFLSEQEAEEISQRTNGYSGADMTNLCREAAYGPVREAAGSLQHISAEEMRPVNFADFEAALKVVKPSVSEKDLDLYVEWNKQFGCGK